MDSAIVGYLAYLIVSVPAAMWVGSTLYRRGRVFLVEIFEGNEDLADAVNHLLAVGFYLVSIGFVAIALRFGVNPNNTREVFESVSTQVGVVLLVLGVMHMTNLLVLKVSRSRVLRLAEPERKLEFAAAGAPAAAATGIRVPGVVACEGCGAANELSKNFCVACGEKLGR
jgi:hypothetical protein